jgi:predicted transcriptional regulator
MTAITLHLPDELAARVAALPADEVNAYAVAALADLVSSSETADPDVGLTEAERAAVREGLARGLADSAAGRVRPAEAVYARLQAKQGVAW